MDGFEIPDFQVSQDDNHVYVDVSCPNGDVGARGATPNVAVEGRIFGFHLEPYYLPLVLPGAAILSNVDDAVHSSHDGRRHYRVTLNKLQPGERFEGLDQLQPQLLPEDQMKQALADAEQSKGFFQPTGGDASSTRAMDDAAKSLLQQALRSQGLTAVNDEDGEAAIDASAMQAGSAAPSSATAGAQGHGFGFRSSFRGSLIPAGCADTRNILEVPNPEAVELAQREQAALAFEEQHWDEGIYMDNFLDIDGELAHLLRFQPSIPASTASGTSSLVDDSHHVMEALALTLQLLFAYSYDERTNEGDPTVESGWTIAKLSHSLAASAPPRTTSATTLESVVSATLIGCARRALTVPLYRHWNLTLACIHDTLLRLEAGATHVKHCLHQIAERLEEGEDPILCRLSEVWLTPLLAEMPDDGESRRLAACVRLQAGELTKDKVGGERWDLEVVEQAAREAYDEGEGGFV
ncbi:SHQ1 protein [Kalmanozyma brasiliensis GHG001]|uniref:Uncharacterized protein n=1 Tax=Kalmanozyma brasiliensis (strain GHG001) TaxID=1365824 RepID=V5EF35_KALBG|nr:SHQ1 protein [Kalmanozyma brasiliensis GHG001]EST09081.1 SHQ1 protein [Kalmanozyma brasiliensis GHG001]